jgi:hypothetical protein
MFKEVSQCTPSVDVLYFRLFNQSLWLLSLSPLCPTSVFLQLSVHILLSTTFTFYGMRYYWCSVILFSFPSFPEFHRVVPLLQTCSTSEFIYDNAGFCLYVYLWIYLPHMRKKTAFVFLILAKLHLTWCLPIASIYLQPHVIIPCGWVTLHCVYTL